MTDGIAGPAGVSMNIRVNAPSVAVTARVDERLVPLSVEDAGQYAQKHFRKGHNRAIAIQVLMCRDRELTVCELVTLLKKTAPRHWGDWEYYQKNKLKLKSLQKRVFQVRDRLRKARLIR